MIAGLKLINLPTGVKDLPNTGNVFVLETCQRTLLFGFGNNPQMPYFQYAADSSQENSARNHPTVYETYHEEAAYQFLLETICGLKSKIQGENEIVGQFKSAYTEYSSAPHKNSHILLLLEKLFKDAKNIRTRYLTKISQQSYAGICRQLILQKHHEGPIIVLGAGALAKDIVKLMAKKFKIYLCARKPSQVDEFVNKYPVQGVPWNAQKLPYFSPVIINTIGCRNLTLFDEKYFNQWRSQAGPQDLFIDLGSPSVVDSFLTTSDGVYRLDDIFKFGDTLNQKKQIKIENAFAAIKDVTAARNLTASLDLPYGWEELQFA